MELLVQEMTAVSLRFDHFSFWTDIDLRINSHTWQMVPADNRRILKLLLPTVSFDGLVISGQFQPSQHGGGLAQRHRPCSMRLPSSYIRSFAR